MRTPQPRGTRGSLKWLQQLVEWQPALLREALLQRGATQERSTIEWRSPRLTDDWAEYRDRSCLELLGISRIAPALESFWPARGPQWDALGVDAENAVYLIEAKAHAGELASSCAAENPVSRRRIAESLEWAMAELGASPAADWMNGYYQCANRITWHRFLRRQGVDSRLVFLYFTGDEDVDGPANESEWDPIIGDMKTALGFAAGARIDGVYEVFVDVAGLSVPRVGDRQ